MVSGFDVLRPYEGVIDTLCFVLYVFHDTIVPGSVSVPRGNVPVLYRGPDKSIQLLECCDPKLNKLCTCGLLAEENTADALITGL